jgi:hypothetical protein
MSHQGHDVREGAPWPFPGPETLAVICCAHVLDRTRPILRVTHDLDDESWQLLRGQSHDGSEAKVVCLGCMVARDATIVQLADLPLGWSADRATVGDSWQRAPNPRDDEDGDAN